MSGLYRHDVDLVAILEGHTLLPVNDSASGKAVALGILLSQLGPVMPCFLYIPLK